MWASAILRLARTIRLPMVGSAIRKARAISPVVIPPSARSVSATRAGISNAGWQQVKISRSRSSTIVGSSSMDGSSWASRRVSSASRSARSATDRLRRSRSIPRRRAAVVIHAPGLAGTPSRRHAVTAASNASCTASSASWKSPACRIRVASTIARSSRNARAIAAETGSAGSEQAGVAKPPKAGELGDLEQLPQGTEKLCGDEPIKLAQVDGFGANSWRKIVRKELESELKPCTNVEISYAQAGGDIQKYNSQINSFVAQGYDIIVTYDDFGPQGLPAIRKAYKAGVTIVPYTSDPGGEDGQDYSAFVTYDREEGGKLFAQWLD